jgi:uncharacterized protein (DUF2249 family)
MVWGGNIGFWAVAVLFAADQMQWTNLKTGPSLKRLLLARLDEVASTILGK